jgi:hypothetical protein
MRDRVIFHAGMNSFSQSAGNASSLHDPDRSMRPASHDEGYTAVANRRMRSERVINRLVRFESRVRNVFHPNSEKRLP